jgi:serine/threonine protein phosphatase 1
VRTSAIGDIHGESILLAELLDLLHSKARPGDTLVFLGDYIDRGPDSRGVIERVLAERERWPGPVVTLMGNHESMLLANLRGRKPEAFERFLYYMGGRPLAASYDAEPNLVSFSARFPSEHYRFLQSLRLQYEDEHGIYVHAGIPSGKDPRHCGEEELLWTAYTGYTFEKPVVFGHEVQLLHRPLDEPGCIGLDTGCGMGGPLTAVILPEREFVSVGPHLVGRALRP